jgi:hypothetical protein
MNSRTAEQSKGIIRDLTAPQQRRWVAWSCDELFFQRPHTPEATPLLPLLGGWGEKKNLAVRPARTAAIGLFLLSISILLLLVSSNELLSATPTLMYRKNRMHISVESLGNSSIGMKHGQCQSLRSDFGVGGSGKACIFTGTSGTPNFTATTMCYHSEQPTAVPGLQATQSTLVPTFFLLGVQKCASTSFAKQLVNLLPQLVLCGGQKERHYFDKTKQDFDPFGYAMCDSNSNSAKWAGAWSTFDCKNEPTWMNNHVCASGSFCDLVQ